MKIYDSIIENVKNLYGDGKRYRTESALAKALDVAPAHIHKLVNEISTTNLKKHCDFLDKLGVKIIFPDNTQKTSREVCFVSAKVAPAGEQQTPPMAEDYIAVPMVAEVGAGPGIIPQGEILSWFLVYKYQDAVRFRTNLVAVQIGKNSTSMKPVLNPGDVVLVDLNDRDTSKPGRIMLVQDPMDNSGMIKRVMVEERNQDYRITFYSDNAAENPPLVYSWREDYNKDWNKVVAGHVVWAWSDVSHK